MTDRNLTERSQCGVIILAAGEGKRMHSPIPKVLHQMGGKPLLFHVLERVREALPEVPIALVVGHGREKVEEYLRSESVFQKMEVTLIVQEQQLGTGHAARCVIDAEWGQERLKENASILVLPGDLPLLSTSLILEMCHSLKKGEDVRVLTCELSEPQGYGRIIRSPTNGGQVLRIVEEKDADSKTRQIHEVAVSIYLFRASLLRQGLLELRNENAQKEYYLTDLIAYSAGLQKGIVDLKWMKEEDLRGVNNLWELSQAHRVLNRRILKDWATRGVLFLDPESTWIDVSVRLAKEVVIHPGCTLSGNTIVNEGAVIESHSVLRDTVVGERAVIKVGTVTHQASIGERANVGPYGHLRPGSLVGARVKIGNFVELKNTKIDVGSSVAHLSYLGDAEVGKNVNIGCGFVTCNFDGRVIDGQRKHKTIIEDDVFLGSDCQAVAPVRIGKGAYIASGSTITQDVEADALAIARPRQVNKLNYARKLRKE